MTRWSLFLQTLSLLHHFLGLYCKGSYEAIEWLTSEKSGVGAKWKQTRTVYGKSHTQTIEVVEWREPTSFALTATEAGATYLTRYSLRGLDVFRGPAQQPVQ